MPKPIIKKKKIAEEEQDPAMENGLGHILLNQHQHLKTRNTLLEHGVVQRAHQNKLLELSTEAHGRSAKAMEKLADNFDPKEIGDGHTFHVKGVKGDKGDVGEDGHTPTPEELLAIIEPLIPKPIHGHTPTEEEILQLVRPLIPEAKHGETPSDERLLALIDSVMPRVEMPTDDELRNLIMLLIPKMPKQKDVRVPTIDEILQSLKGKFKYEHLADKPNLDTFRKGGGLGAVQEIPNVDAAGLADGYTIVWNAAKQKWLVQLAGTGSGGANFETPTGAINNSNVTYTVIHTPKAVLLNGATYFENDGYTLSGFTITMLVVPMTGSTLRSMY